MELESFKNRDIREYHFSEILGFGGMGAVFKAVHTRLDAVRAIKVLRPKYLNDENFKTRFEREAKTLARLENPYIIRVYEFFEEENHLFLVMEYVEGDSIADRINYFGRLPIENTVKLFSQACGGLFHAHSKGIIHRDLSPDNILITGSEDDEKTKIIDFGIAKAVFDAHELQKADQSGLTTPGIFIGKIKYCSPEQALGKELDPKSDQYSLALILYEALVGSYPFQSETAMGSLTKRLHESVPDFEKVAPEVSFPLGMEEVIKKALAVKPEERFDDLLEFKNALANTVLPAETAEIGEELTGISDDKTLVADDKKTRETPMVNSVETEPESEIKSEKKEAEFKPISLADEIAESGRSYSRYPSTPSTFHHTSRPVKRVVRHPVKPVKSKKLKTGLIVFILLMVGLIGGATYGFFTHQPWMNTVIETGEKLPGIVVNLLNSEEKEEASVTNKNPQRRPRPEKKKTYPSRKNLSKPENDADAGPFLATSNGVKPPKVLKKVSPQIPFGLEDLDYPKTVMVSVVVLANGKLGNMTVMSIVPSEIENAAMAAIQQYKFKGGSKYGKPADIIVDLPVVFKK